MKRSILLSLVIIGAAAALLGAGTSAVFITTSSDDGVLTAGSINITVGDSDGDWVANALDNCPDWVNPLQNLPAWTVPAGDPDCDGFPASTAQAGRAPESFLGTDSGLACGPDAWPADFNNDAKVSLSDVLAYLPVMNAVGPGLPYMARFDLNQDNSDALPDILNLIPFFGRTCTP